MQLNLSEVNGRCAFHDELRREYAREIHAAGSRARSGVLRELREAHEGAPRPMRDIKSALLWLSWCAEQLRLGHITDKQALAHAGAAKTYIYGCNLRDLEQKLRRATKELAMLKGKGLRVA